MAAEVCNSRCEILHYTIDFIVWFNVATVVESSTTGSLLRLRNEFSKDVLLIQYASQFVDHSIRGEYRGWKEIDIIEGFDIKPVQNNARICSETFDMVPVKAAKIITFPMSLNENQVVGCCILRPDLMLTERVNQCFLVVFAPFDITLIDKEKICSSIVKALYCAALPDVPESSPKKNKKKKTRGIEMKDARLLTKEEAENFASVAKILEKASYLFSVSEAAIII